MRYFLIFLLAATSLACQKPERSALEQAMRLREQPLAGHWLGQSMKMRTRIEENENDADAHFYLARAFGNLYLWQKATQSLQRSIAIDSENAAGAWFYLGEAFLALGEYRDARRALKSSLEQPGLAAKLVAQAHVMLGTIAIKLEQPAVVREHIAFLQTEYPQWAKELHHMFLDKLMSGSW